MTAFRSILGKDALVWRMAALAVVAFTLSRLSILFVKTVHQLPPIMPTAALMILILLSAQPRRRWLYLAAYVVGHCAAGYWVEQAGPWRAMTTVANMLVTGLTGVLVAYGLLRWFRTTAPDFARPRDLALFGFATCVVGPGVTVCAGAVMAGLIGHKLGPMDMFRWAAANCIGTLILAPGLMILRDSAADFRRAAISRQGLFSLAALVLVTLFAFSPASHGTRYMIPPALALTAIYLEFPGVALGGLIVSLVAFGSVCLGLGDGAASAGYIAGSFFQTQIFLGFTLAVNLPFAALLVQRRRMRDALLRAKLAAEVAQAEVVEQQRRSALAEEIAKVGFWRIDFATGRFELSAQNHVILGLDRNDPSDMNTLASYTHPDDRERRKSAFALLRAGEPSMSSWRIIRKDGEVRNLVMRGVPEFDARGAVRAAFGTVVDVTELTQTQEALAKSAARLRLITSNVADVIVQTDLDDRITFISPSVEANLGYTPEEMLGSTWSSLLHPEDAHLWSDALDQLMRANGNAAIESIRCRARTKDGRELCLALRPSLILDEQTGDPVGVVDVARDVTERTRMFADLKAAQAAAEKASAVKGEFLANMSHEIRTPLTSISGFTALAETQSDLSPQTRRYIGHINSATGALLAIVNDVLDFSKLEAGEIRIEKRPTDVQAVMRDTLNLFSGKSEEKGLTLGLAYPDDAPVQLMVDPDRLRQVLTNLAGNAMKFTETGGVRMNAAYDAQAQSLRIEVADTGPGIAADRMSDLFQRFSQIDGSVTRKFGGTGLGLAISKGLVEAMGGEVGVSSVLGQGSCFWFAVPAAPAVALAEPALASTDLGPMDGLRVLVVDDNSVNRELIRALLTPLGAQVVEAEDGEIAVEQAQHRPFDVILMDLRMPGMSGRQAAQAIAHSTGPNAVVPIIAFSADGADEAATGDLAGQAFAGRLTKPFKPMQLITTLMSAVNGEASTDERDVA